jgi:hypothetical protein
VPAVIRRVLPAQPRVLVPPRMAMALEPELNRAAIPPRVTLDASAPPFAGELREDQHGFKVDCPPGSFTVLATLRRAWNFVGFSIDPGDAVSPFTDLALTLRTLGSGMNGFVANQGLPTLIGGSGTLSFVGFTIGAPCELIFINATSGEASVTVHGVRGEIWGMGEK